MNGLLRDLAESLKIDAESLQHTISISKVKSAEANLVVLLTAFASLLLAKDLSRDDAEDMLEKLAAHYGEPVQPVSRYCASLRLWQRALHERAERALLALAPDLVDEKDSSRQFEIRSAIDKEVRKAESAASADALNRMAALEAVARAAETPDCNYNTERECGVVNGVYKHHPKWCPRGRLDAALAKLAEVRRG